MARLRQQPLSSRSPCPRAHGQFPNPTRWALAGLPVRSCAILPGCRPEFHSSFFSYYVCVLLCSFTVCAGARNVYVRLRARGRYDGWGAPTAWWAICFVPFVLSLYLSLTLLVSMFSYIYIKHTHKYTRMVRLLVLGLYRKCAEKARGEKR